MTYACRYCKTNFGSPRSRREHEIHDHGRVQGAAAASSEPMTLACCAVTRRQLLVELSRAASGEAAKKQRQARESTDVERVGLAAQSIALDAFAIYILTLTDPDQ